SHTTSGDVPVHQHPRVPPARRASYCRAVPRRRGRWSQGGQAGIEEATKLSAKLKGVLEQDEGAEGAICVNEQW
ncbi:unnamed protein product, partial [Ectocarpus sp. 12 AP-2014]